MLWASPASEENGHSTLNQKVNKAEIQQICSNWLLLNKTIQSVHLVLGLNKFLTHWAFITMDWIKMVLCFFILICMEIVFFVFVFLGLYPRHMEVLASGQIGATAASLCHCHSNARSELHLRPTPQLTATPDRWPTERGQRLKLHPHGY